MSSEQASHIEPAWAVGEPRPAGGGPSRGLRRWGTSAVVAGLLWAAGVGGEIVLQPQHPDGSVAAPVVFAFCAGAGVAGSVFLVAAFRGIRAAVLGSGRAAGAPVGRAFRAGSWCCIAGAVLLLVFSAVSLVSGLAAGAVWEPSFLAFALGMLVLLAGQLTLGLAVRRHEIGSGGVWSALVGASACIAVALAVPVDPWHDLGMFGLFAAWVALGGGLRRRQTS